MNSAAVRFSSLRSGFVALIASVAIACVPRIRVDTSILQIAGHACGRVVSADGVPLVDVSVTSFTEWSWTANTGLDPTAENLRRVWVTSDMVDGFASTSRDGHFCVPAPETPLVLQFSGRALAQQAAIWSGHPLEVTLLPGENEDFP